MPSKNKCTPKGPKPQCPNLRDYFDLADAIFDHLKSISDLDERMRCTDDSGAIVSFICRYTKDFFNSNDAPPFNAALKDIFIKYGFEEKVRHLPGVKKVDPPSFGLKTRLICIDPGGFDEATGLEFLERYTASGMVVFEGQLCYVMNPWKNEYNYKLVERSHICEDAPQKRKRGLPRKNS